MKDRTARSAEHEAGAGEPRLGAAPAPTDPGEGGAFEPFRFRDYRLFWLSGAVANSGRWMQLITLQKIVFDLTDSEAWAGAVGFASQLPVAFMSPLGGSLGDRFPRRRILRVTQAAYAVVATGFLMVWLSGVRAPLTFLLLGAATGLVSGLNLPVWQAFVGDLVPRRVLMKAVTLNSAQFNAARALGPVLAGAVLAVWGPGAALGINAAAYGLVLFLLALITTESRPGALGPQGSVMADLRAAIGQARATPGVARAISLALVLGFLALPLVSLIVVFAEDVFEVDSFLFGLLIAAQGIGAVIAAPIVSMSSSRFTRSALAGGSLLLYGVAMVVFASSSIYVVALLAIVALGACHITAASSLNTTVQLQVDPTDRSKVLSVYLMVLLGASPLGSLTLGLVAEATSPRLAVTINAVALLLVVGVMAASGRLAAMNGERDDAAAAAELTTEPDQSSPGS